MVKQFVFTVCVLLTASSSLFGEYLSISFDLLEKHASSGFSRKYDGKEVKIRGFGYQAEDGRYVLASQPNLKSCCVGASRKIHQQIILKGSIPDIPRNKAVTVLGSFATDPTYNEEDELIGLYYLKNIRLLNEMDEGVVYSLLIFFVVIAFLMSIVIVYKRKNRN